MRRIRDGFTGQKMLVLPEEVNRQTAQSPLTQSLYITNIGFFPHAHFHYVERETDFKQYILIYCISGQGWYRLNHHTAIKAGQYFILPAKQAHQYGAAPENPWTIYWFHFTGHTSAEVWNLYRLRHFPAGTIPFSQQRIDLFNKLYDTLEKGYSNEHTRFTSLSLGYLMSSFLYPNIFEQKSEHKNPDAIDRAIEYMQNNLSVSLSLKELSGHVNYSIPHLASEFKKKTGYSAIDYHNRLRIQKACQYLSLTDMRIKEIAFSLGFKDPYYFSRLFSKVIGKSPRSYKYDNLER